METTNHPQKGHNEKAIEGRIKLNLDTILVEEIGQFGLYQLRSMILAIIVVIFAACVASEYIFTTARINTRYSYKYNIIYHICIFV